MHSFYAIARNSIVIARYSVATKKETIFLIKQKPKFHQTWQHRKFSTYSSNGFDVYALPNWCWQRKTTLTVCNNHKKYEPKCKMCGLPYYGFLFCFGYAMAIKRSAIAETMYTIWRQSLGWECARKHICMSQFTFCPRDFIHWHFRSVFFFPLILLFELPFSTAVLCSHSVLMCLHSIIVCMNEM